ncbi:BrnT family toxin [Halochromatium roseum]|uniref:BrnT family toxin n=1 Tax=Halochromatium roseum TaxID=391920 RepID=UPI001911C8D3|nr:hypothetical protein [Halochromatium roseum]
MKLAWDHKKAQANLRNHGIRFEEASTVFGDPMALTFNDPDHSIGESLFLTFGMTRYGTFLIVSFAETNSETRLISARKMSKREREIYENG